VHGSGFPILLNRTGRSLAEPDGSAASRIEVTFTDNSLADIHNAIEAASSSRLASPCHPSQHL
jgi:hypothetical protein